MCIGIDLGLSCSRSMRFIVSKYISSCDSSLSVFRTKSVMLFVRFSTKKKINKTSDRECNTHTDSTIDTLSLVKQTILFICLIVVFFPFFELEHVSLLLCSNFTICFSLQEKKRNEKNRSKGCVYSFCVHEEGSWCIWWKWSSVLLFGPNGNTQIFNIQKRNFIRLLMWAS